MNFTLSHPAIVHVPLGLAIVMPLLAAVLAVAIWRGRLPRSAFAVVAGLQLLLVSAGLVALRLGHADAEGAERVAPEQVVDAHEEAAEAFEWVAIGVLVAAVVALAAPPRRFPALGALVTAGAVATAALGVNAGAKGGELVFRHGAGVERAALPAPAGEAGTVPPAAGRDDD
jgi:uncharacterized membrane protein